MTARLVTLGDSLTHGFQHAAIRRPEWGYAAMVARALAAPDFRFADFSGAGVGGPLVDLELLLHRISAVCGHRLNVWDYPEALLAAQHFMSDVEEYWERGPGTRASFTGPLHHNLAVWGFEVLDALTLSDAVCHRNTPTASNQWINQIPECAMYRSARRVFNPAQLPQLEECLPLELAAKLSAEEGGIETLIVALGSNNVLGTCVRLALRWSQSADIHKLSHQRECTIWEPEHFARIYRTLSQGVASLAAGRTFVATVPHVTVAPVTRGVSPGAANGREALYRGYYEYYTRFWIWDDEFNPDVHPHLTREDVMKVDATIDAYNQIIRAAAQEFGFGVIDLCGVLDELAFRRQQGRPVYRFPEGLVRALKENPATAFRVRPDNTILLDTRYLSLPEQPPSELAPSSTWQEQYTGGLFGLDGVHPTTVGYGIIAHEVLRTLSAHGVAGADADQLPWDSIVANDGLLIQPPPVLSSLQRTLRWVFSHPPLARAIEKTGGYGAEPL